ncbi:L-histidine N(alpha)-methyltransferase [Microbulbifer celer]|uniref:L-histidine N(Alpha)-methyltransferase n=1 Tax=Microbulbifer celer TaxID=435905 RepID=A0ABW3U737_9GAMM|nr:L-histidine N(alpha)-methyltransferase [Microbulbifer celer]
MNIALQTPPVSAKENPSSVGPEEGTPPNEFTKDVIAGLTAPQKTLPCKYLYDEAGSRIFEQICELEDYYLTRTEAEIFSSHLPDIAKELGTGVTLIEPGAGNCEKAEPLLAIMESPEAYIPIDISPEILLGARARFEASQPELLVRPVIGDFTQMDRWGDEEPGNRQVVFFPGSTIGNFTHQQAQNLLQHFAAQMAPGDGLLLGVDLVKDSVVLERAYHDDRHVTEAFNKNLLRRINRELGADFDLDAFSHRAFYHPLRQRVEMHLVSLKDQQVRVADLSIPFLEGESIHTENSHKYTLESLASLLNKAGFQQKHYWTDTNNHYVICYAEIF